MDGKKAAEKVVGLVCFNLYQVKPFLISHPVHVLCCVHSQTTNQQYNSVTAGMTSSWWAKFSLVVVKKRIDCHNVRGQLNNPSPGTVIDTQVTKPEWWVYPFTRLRCYNAWLDILGGFAWYSPDILGLDVLGVNIAYEVGTFKSKIYPPSLSGTGSKTWLLIELWVNWLQLMHMAIFGYMTHSQFSI